MRLGVPPALKFSNLIDTNNLSPKSSIYPSSRHKSGIKISSAAFKQDGDSQFAQDVGVNDLISLQSKFSNIRLMSPVNGTHKKKNIQSAEESILSEIKISQSSNGRSDNQYQIKEKQLSSSKSQNLKRKNSPNNSLTILKESSPDSLRNTVKSLNVIEVINEEQSLSYENSLKSSIRILKKVNSTSSLRRNSDQHNDLKESRIRQPTEKFNEQKNTGWQAPTSQFDINEWPVLFQKQIERIRNKSNIEMDEVESTQSVSPLNSSQESCQTVNVVQVIDGIREIQQKISLNKIQSKEQNSEKVVKQLLEIEKSLKPNGEYSMYNGTEIDKSTNSVIHSNKKSDFCNSIKDEEKKLLSGISERFKKMKEIKTGKQQNNREKETINILSSQISKLSKSQSSQQLKNRAFSQKGVQTDTLRSEPILRPNLQQVSKKHGDQINMLQRQISKLNRQLSTNKDSYSKLQTVKGEIQQENNLLVQRVKRLERKLQKNESELLQWKQCAKEGEREHLQDEKVNSFFKQKNVQWKHREQRYINQIAELSKELHRANYLLRSEGKQEFSSQETSKVSKENRKYQKHMQLLQQQEQNLSRNMQTVKRQQQKIIQQWRLIDRFYTNVNMRQRKQGCQIVQPKRAPNNCKKVESLQLSDYNAKENDLASLSVKIKAMRNQLAKETK